MADTTVTVPTLWLVLPPILVLYAVWVWWLWWRFKPWFDKRLHAWIEGRAGGS